MDVETSLQLIICILIGLSVYITIAIFFIAYTFNRAFLSYNQKFEIIKELLTELKTFREDKKCVKREKNKRNP